MQIEVDLGELGFADRNFGAGKRRQLVELIGRTGWELPSPCPT